MKLNKKVTIITICCVLFSIIYICLAAQNLNDQLSIKPVWTVPILNNFTETNQINNLIHTKLGQNIVYFLPDGTITNSIPFPFCATTTTSHYSPTS